MKSLALAFALCASPVAAQLVSPTTAYALAWDYTGKVDHFELRYATSGDVDERRHEAANPGARADRRRPHGASARLRDEDLDELPGDLAGVHRRGTKKTHAPLSEWGVGTTGHCDR